MSEKIAGWKAKEVGYIETNHEESVGIEIPIGTIPPENTYLVVGEGCVINASHYCEECGQWIGRWMMYGYVKTWCKECSDKLGITDEKVWEKINAEAQKVADDIGLAGWGF